MKMKTKIKRILESGQSHWGKMFDLAELLPTDRDRRVLACDYANRAVTNAASQGVSLSDCVAGARLIAEGRATEDERRKFYAAATATAAAAAAAAATAAAAAATATAAAAAATATTFYFGFYGWRFDFETDDPGILAERQWQIDHVVALLEKLEAES
jgi:hypothetical protein